MQTFAADYLDLLRSQLTEMHKLLRSLPAEALDWSPGKDVNSVAVLAAHLAGSNKYWLGDVLGSRESQRDRDAEFATHSVDPIELSGRLEATLADITPIIEALTTDEMAGVRFSTRHGRDYTVPWVLLHALEHTSQHVGHAQTIGQIWLLQQAE